MPKATYDVAIIGGGLAGLTAAIDLSRSGLHVILIEKNTYPHHKVCGEYISNEVLPYLITLGINPIALGASEILKFEISRKDGQLIQADLPLGGFGISRYTLDNILYCKAKESAEVLHANVTDVAFKNTYFTIKTGEDHLIKATYVLGAFGKRSNLDKALKRKFIAKKSPWLAVKGHFEYELAGDKVSLHNFDGGYCGLSTVEDSVVNACYLTTYDSFKKWGDIKKFQQQTMSANPHLKSFFKTAKPLFDAPLTISQISFERKAPVENHIFMIGDSAGLIHPLCGNGMAMAIQSAQLLAILIKKHFNDEDARALIEKAYITAWATQFNKRLSYGRYIQKMLLNTTLTAAGYRAAQLFPGIVPQLIKRTHGAPL